jgi:hypothetical protein
MQKYLYNVRFVDPKLLKKLKNIIEEDMIDNSNILFFFAC